MIHLSLITAAQMLPGDVKPLIVFVCRKTDSSDSGGNRSRIRDNPNQHARQLKQQRRQLTPVPPPDVPGVGIDARATALENSARKIGTKVVKRIEGLRFNYLRPVFLQPRSLIATPGALLSPFGLAGKPEEIQKVSIATARVLWTYSLAFAFSMTGAAVLESFGLTRFLFVTRLIMMWLISIPTIYAITSTHVGNPGILPTCWVVGSIFEAVIGVAYFLRIFYAIRKRQNGIVLTYAESRG